MKSKTAKTRSPTRKILRNFKGIYLYFAENLLVFNINGKNLVSYKNYIPT